MAGHPLGIGSHNAQHDFERPIDIHKGVSELPKLARGSYTTLALRPGKSESFVLGSNLADSSVCPPTMRAIMRAEPQHAPMPHVAPTVLQAIRALNREVGPTWLVRGMGPTLLRAFVINGVNFACFEWLKDRVEAMHR